MEKITRKSLIYKTGVEYGDYTLNHVLGCSHGCKYPCYAMLLKKRFGAIKDYDDWVKPRLVSNYKEIIERELPKLKNKIDTLHLCFTTDPFMVGYPEIINASIDILNIVADNNVKASVLTKGVIPKEIAHLPKNFSLGISLVSFNENFRINIEPNTAPYKDRIKSLKDMADFGFNTWVSIEPYPTPNIVQQELKDILTEVNFVNKIIFGRMNYSKTVSGYKGHKEFYNECAETVIKFCKRNKIECHIKEGTVT